MHEIITDGSPDGKGNRLLPQHLEDLRKSGLRDEIIADSGIYSETDGDRVKELLGDYMAVKTARALGPCLAFPFVNADRKPMTWLLRDENGTERVLPFVRFKPDKPRKRDGKTTKYESPLKSGNRVYIPPGVGSVLADPAKELVIVEGEKKALAGTQDGFPTVALSGVWNWVIKRPKNPATGKGMGPRKLIEDLQQINWKGRKVTIIFDSDLKDKPEIEWARWQFARTLVKCGADVRVVDLPPCSDGAKCGLDDFLIAHGPTALRLLLDTARPPTQPATENRDDRPPVLIGPDEHRVNDEVI